MTTVIITTLAGILSSFLGLGASTGMEIKPDGAWAYRDAVAVPVTESRTQTKTYEEIEDAADRPMWIHCP